jgi:hypothetical protein
MPSRVSVKADPREARVKRGRARGRSQNPAIFEQLKVVQ